MLFLRRHRLATWRVVILGVLITVGATQVSAQWKWVDANGRTQYTQLPPPVDTPAENVLVRPASSHKVFTRVSETKKPNTGSLLEKIAKKAKSDAEEAERLQREEVEAEKRRRRVADEKSASLCKQSSAYLKTLDSGRVIRKTNDAGQYVILNNDARASERSRAEEMIKNSCR